MIEAVSASNSWIDERAQWQQYFTRNISSQVKRSIAFIKKNKRSPQKVNQHFESIQLLFEQAINHPSAEIRILALEITQALDPLPLWWGKWSDWIEMLSKTAQISAKEKLPKNQAWAHITQAKVLLHGIDVEKALRLSQYALDLARKHQDQIIALRAEILIFEAKRHLGKIKNNLQHIKILENSLQKKEAITTDFRKEFSIELLLKKSDILQRQGDIEKAIYYTKKALSQSESLPKNSPLRAQIHVRRGGVFWADNNFNQAIEEFSTALKILLNDTVTGSRGISCNTPTSRVCGLS